MWGVVSERGGEGGRGRKGQGGWVGGWTMGRVAGMAGGVHVCASNRYVTFCHYYCTPRTNLLVSGKDEARGQLPETQGSICDGRKEKGEGGKGVCSGPNLARSAI